jgi:hypothetical protein
VIELTIIIIIIIYVTVSVTTVTITPAGDNNVVDIIEGETQTFTCTTDASRPAAWIQWYIGGLYRDFSVDLTFCLPSILTASQKIDLL